MNPLVIGVDFGTDSVRSVLIDTTSGNELASSVFNYPRWAERKYCDASKNQFRQHPLDYLEGLTASIQDIVKRQASTLQSDQVKAISIDTTGSTPAAVDRDGTVLALKAEFKENPHAMFILWKDHTATKEAAEINDKAKNWGGEDYTRFSGGVYSSEWYWSKILRTIREDASIREAAFSWVEHCDWIPAILTGTEKPEQIKRSRCAAGHKALWHQSWGGLPPEAFLTTIDPLLSGIRERLYTDTFTADLPAGTLTEEWAERLGLQPGTAVGVGAFDAHMGAVGGEARANSFVKVIGTSTCDILTAPIEEVGSTLVDGICGQVEGSVVPDMVGLEAGQSAFGDVYAWFKNLISWPADQYMRNEQQSGKTDCNRLADFLDELIPRLNAAAADTPIDSDNIVSLDWLNGRRTPYANQELKGAITGLDLGSDAPRVFRSLVESTAFGAKRIFDQFIEQGIPVKEVIAIGGVAKKSPFVMQTLADVFNREIKVANAEQTVALGAAMFAAVVGGVFETLDKAQQAMGSGFGQVYHPIPERVEVYKHLYAKYQRMGEFIERELTETIV